MKTVVEPLEGNKVKLSVEVDQVEFENALEAAFRKIAREVRIPGFRPGKVPRRVLEARIGKDAARQEALRDAVPDYYAQAVRDQDVDPIAPPEIDITSDGAEGPLAFDAVVEIRPTVGIAGYAGLEVTVPRLEVTDEDIDAQIDRLRDTFAELQEVDRPALDGDHVTIDLSGSRQGEPVEGMSTEDFLYEVGSGGVVAELDDQLRGAKVGDILSFAAPVQDEPTDFRVLVKGVRQKILPEVTDEWASEASEFETVADLRADLSQRLGSIRRVQARLALRDGALQSLSALVAEEAPAPLVNEEIERRVHDLSHRLEAQGANLIQYLQAIGRSQDDFVAELREAATEAVKADLALRALAEAEDLTVDDAEVEAEISALAGRYEVTPAQLRRQLEQNDQLSMVAIDVRKGKALQWLIDHVSLVDEEGRPVDRAGLEDPQEDAAAVDEDADDNARAERAGAENDHTTAEVSP